MKNPKIETAVIQLWYGKGFSPPSMAVLYSLYPFPYLSSIVYNSYYAVLDHAVWIGKLTDGFGAEVVAVASATLRPQGPCTSTQLFELIF